MDWQKSKNNPYRKMNFAVLTDSLEDKSKEELIDEYVSSTRNTRN